MHRPRLLALLILFAALLALGAWTLMHERPGAVENALASAPEPEAARDALLAVDPEAHPQRQEAAAPVVPLTSSNRIRGRVVRGSQSVPVAGIEVRCSKNAPPTRMVGPVRIDIGARFQTEEPGPSCTSGPDGSFEFTGLDPSALYTLRARGIGWLLVEPLAAIAPAEDERTLAVRRIYTARVLATDENGLPPVSSCEYLRYARVAGLGECESTPLSQASEGSASEGSPPSQVYEFASDCDAPSLGPFRILICCTGFERQDFEFWAYPEGFQSDVTTLRLKRVRDDTGTLRLSQVCGCKGSFCDHLVEGELELVPAEGSGKPLLFDLTGLEREQDFAGIPKGRWQLRVRARRGGFLYPSEGEPPQEVSIGAEALLVQLSVHNLGAIRWHVRGTGEELAREQLRIFRRVTDRVEERTDIWMSVVMRGVPAGEHAFEVETDKFSSVEGAFATAGSGRSILHVQVAPGEAQEVVVHTP